MNKFESFISRTVAFWWICNEKTFFSPHYLLLIIIMYIYHALINALSVHMIHINLNMILYTHVEQSPTKTIYIKYYKKYI